MGKTKLCRHAQVNAIHIFKQGLAAFSYQRRLSLHKQLNVLRITKDQGNARQKFPFLTILPLMISYRSLPWSLKFHHCSMKAKNERFLLNTSMFLVKCLRVSWERGYESKMREEVGRLMLWEDKSYCL